ncbi:hypothetical protein LguiB_035031 [Lonicera macranthoides]
MDLYLKEWREQQQQQQHESESDQQQQQQPLPLFSSEPTTTTTTSTATNYHLSAPFLSPTHPSTFPRMANGSSGYLSVGQRQELEVQALIYKHVLAGASIPPQLQLLFNKTLLNSSPSPYYHLQHYSPYYHPSLLQSGGGGYWGRGGMDPEPGRCRRTDGKKWRCSRDVVSGHKYCERHVHRGRNRSRKPVEIPTLPPPPPPPPHGGGGGVGVILKTNINNAAIAAQSFTPMAVGGSTHFALSGTSPSFDLLHSNRSSDLIYENKGLFRATQNDLSHDGKSGDRILRHFFDDWPKSVQEHENASSTTNSATGLSISIPENPSSDFSLKLSTGNGEEQEANNLQGGGNYNVDERRERAHLNWGSTWGSNQVGSMGGPLAEALRSSSTSNSSPTSVLHQLQRGSASEASCIST